MITGNCLPTPPSPYKNDPNSNVDREYRSNMSRPTLTTEMVCPTLQYTWTWLQSHIRSGQARGCRVVPGVGSEQGLGLIWGRVDCDWGRVCQGVRVLCLGLGRPWGLSVPGARGTVPAGVCPWAGLTLVRGLSLGPGQTLGPGLPGRGCPKGWDLFMGRGYCQRRG
uniref:Uncharacterized protein n=1 Tax=Knipowitschia caucasica TaxID=637954 RepID=A0AAV2MN16_KNICA